MAPESLTEMVFSSQSDVWSFGIVLWEIFSLGKVPYPGMGLNQLIRALQSGYRMEKPQFASNDIGQVMLDCWKTTPNERPTFYQLQETHQPIRGIRWWSLYMEMNDSYLKLDRSLMNKRSSPSALDGASALPLIRKRSTWHDFIGKKKEIPLYR